MGMDMDMVMNMGMIPHLGVRYSRLLGLLVDDDTVRTDGREGRDTPHPAPRRERPSSGSVAERNRRPGHLAEVPAHSDAKRRDAEATAASHHNITYFCF